MQIQENYHFVCPLFGTLSVLLYISLHCYLKLVLIGHFKYGSVFKTSQNYLWSHSQAKYMLLLCKTLQTLLAIFMFMVSSSWCLFIVLNTIMCQKRQKLNFKEIVRQNPGCCYAGLCRHYEQYFCRRLAQVGTYWSF